MFRFRVRVPQAGFTLLEMAFVMVIVGIVAAGFIPALQDLHHKAMQDEDKRLIAKLRDVLIGQFLATGKLPQCINASGAVSTSGNCNTSNSLGSLAVQVKDSRGNDIQYDVRAELSAYADLASACSGLNSLISSTNKDSPYVCHEAPDYNDSSTWSTYCSTQDQVAFVLVGTGLNRKGQSGEVATSTSSLLGNRNIGSDRVFESSSRRLNTTWYYDDLIEVVTLEQLRSAIPSTSCP